MNDAIDLVVREAALLDARRFDDWLALYDAECLYWVPLLGAAQADPRSHNAIACEDRLLLQLRVDRLKNPRAHSQHPASHCQHVLQRSVPEAGEGGEGGEAVLRTPFIYIEARGESQVLLTGSYRHRLVRIEDGWRIREKRVDLLNPGQALPAIQLFI
ncbi:aromatic-ring-hydroxylating dioxygenase subunit beta [Variovorax sp. DAIF25]|uniref:aromatic-ring-hydroxylating dioxygenase subunit beta n=1 Tax=Variovorax sp. DAIF25 TaxID=3080983 RepID=UPI003D6C1FEF